MKLDWIAYGRCNAGHNRVPIQIGFKAIAAVPLDAHAAAGWNGNARVKCDGKRPPYKHP